MLSLACRGLGFLNDSGSFFVQIFVIATRSSIDWASHRFIVTFLILILLFLFLFFFFFWIISLSFFLRLFFLRLFSFIYLLGFYFLSFFSFTALLSPFKKIFLSLVIRSSSLFTFHSSICKNFRPLSLVQINSGLFVLYIPSLSHIEFFFFHCIFSQRDISWIFLSLGWCNPWRSCVASVF